MNTARHLWGLTAAVMVVAGGICAQETPDSRKAGGTGGSAAEIQVDPAIARRVDEYVQFQASLPNSVFGTNLKYQGVVPMLWQAPNPLQIINPLAPANYGDGHQNVIVDPSTRQQQGIKLIQVRF